MLTLGLLGFGLFILALLLILLFLESCALGETLELGDKRLGGLVVHAGQCGNVRDEVVQQRFVKLGCIIGNKRLLSEYHSLSSLRVGREKTPIDEATVSQIYIVR